MRNDVFTTMFCIFFYFCYCNTENLSRKLHLIISLLRFHKFPLIIFGNVFFNLSIN